MQVSDKFEVIQRVQAKGVLCIDYFIIEVLFSSGEAKILTFLFTLVIEPVSN